MRFSFQSTRRSGLTALFSLLLSIPNIANAAALPQDGLSSGSLVARGDLVDQYDDVTGKKLPGKAERITQKEYEDYLKTYYPQTDKYLLYTGESEGQVKTFIENTKINGAQQYFYYDDFFNADKSKYYNKAFPENSPRGYPYMDDAEASSKAISAVASKQVLVFGGAQYQTLGASSFYTTEEVPNLRNGFQSGRLQSVNHMVQGATRPDQPLATEDLHSKPGKFTYKGGATKDTTNAGSGASCKAKPHHKRGTPAKTKPNKPTDSKPTNKKPAKRPILRGPSC